MRTKTVLLSALLGSLGTVAVMAQSNVYSLNVVGYINETAYPGFNIISVPLLCTDASGAQDNTVSNLFPNASGQYKKMQIWTYNPTLSQPYSEDVGTASGWNDATGGAETIVPGQAVWFNNTSTSNVTLTFVGTVPTNTVTTTLYASSFNLVGSAIPASGDIVTNSLMLYTTGTKKDQVWTYNPLLSQPFVETVATASSWNNGDPQMLTVGGGFFYLNSQTTNNYWNQSYSVTNQ